MKLAGAVFIVDVVDGCIVVLLPCYYFIMKYRRHGRHMYCLFRGRYHRIQINYSTAYVE